MQRREWMKTTGRLLLASGAFALPGLALGQGHRRGRGPRGGGMRMLRDLDLTEDQRESMKAMAEANREQMESTNSTLHEARKALNEAVESGAEEFEIRSLADQLANAEGDAAVLRAGHVKQLKAMLSQEQLDTLEQKKAERDQRMEERRKQFRERRGQRRGRDSRENDLW